MRVIAGTHRSRTLLPPEGDRVTRPITDRVKQALFDRLWSIGAFDTGRALDLFAGTGSLGIEALSRGVEHVTFVERDRDARTRLEQNLASLQLTDRATVLSLDAFAVTRLTALTRPPQVGVGSIPGVGLVFCDPPYQVVAQAPERVAALMAGLAAAVAAEAVLVLRTDAKTPAPTAAGWTPPDTHRYGSMALHFYVREAAPPHLGSG